ncbi:hypothetical protein BDQ17DRAFT_1547330 [Cyathus striatus]|nr:hypothetical protein BDQ17DRAFT_1547330 [Cyathus striatus]
MQPDIPPEVTDQIIDQVALLDDIGFPDLKACAVTCKGFLKRSRYHLFHAISLTFHIQPLDPWVKYTSIQDTLQSSPELANLVHKFHLRDCSRGMFVTHPALPGILGALQNIEMFSLSFGLKMYDWENFKPDMKHAIFTILSSPCIKSVNLRMIRNLPPVFGQLLSRIPTIHIAHISFGVQDFQRSQLQVTKPETWHATKALIIRDITPTILPLLDELTSRRCKLETLAVIITDRETIKLCLNIMENHKAYLTKLDLVDLEYYRNEEDYIDDIKNILETAREENEIRDIVICINFDTLNSLSGYKKPGWRNMDLLLTESRRFKQLQNVAFFYPLFRSLSGSVEVEHVKDLIAEFLPRLEKKNMIQYSYS